MKTITDAQLDQLIDTLDTAYRALHTGIGTAQAMKAVAAAASLGERIKRSVPEDETPIGLAARLRAMKEGDEIWTKHYNVLALPDGEWKAIPRKFAEAGDYDSDAVFVGGTPELAARDLWWP